MGRLSLAVSLVRPIWACMKSGADAVAALQTRLSVSTREQPPSADRPVDRQEHSHWRRRWGRWGRVYWPRKSTHIGKFQFFRKFAPLSKFEHVMRA